MPSARVGEPCGRPLLPLHRRKAQGLDTVGGGENVIRRKEDVMSTKGARVRPPGGVLLLVLVLLVWASADARAEWEPENQDPFCAFADWQIWGDVCYAFLILSGGMACANNPRSCPGQCNVWGMPPPPDCPDCPWTATFCEAGGGSGTSRPACCQYGQDCVQVTCYLMSA